MISLIQTPNRNGHTKKQVKIPAYISVISNNFSLILKNIQNESASDY